MTEASLDRRDIMGRLFPDPDRYLFVTGLAGAARDMAALTNESDNLLTMGGAMGAAVSIGLGMALAAPEAQVAVVTGDGELMMNVGALATVASMMPDNLTVVCVDNGVHGETGGQPGHTSRRTKLALMAEGAGLPSTMEFERADQFDAAAKFLVEAPAPRLLVARVTAGPPPEYKRDWDLAANRVRFRKAYLEKSGGA